MPAETLEQPIQKNDSAPSDNQERVEPFEKFESTREAARWFEDLALEIGQREVNITMAHGLTEDDFKETFRKLNTGPGRHATKSSPTAELLQQRKLDIPGRELHITICDEVSAFKPERMTEKGTTINIEFTDDNGGRFVAKLEQSFWGQDYKKGESNGRSRIYNGVVSTVEYTTNEGITDMRYTSSVEADSNLDQSKKEEIQKSLEALSTMRALIMWRVRTVIPEAVEALEKARYARDHDTRSAFGDKAELRKRGLIRRFLGASGYVPQP